MIVVASHDNDEFLTRLIDQLTQTNLNGHDVLIIDTNSKTKKYIDTFNSLKETYRQFKFFSMIDTTWDTGAYIFAYKNFYADRYIFLQDSIVLTNPNIFLEFDNRLEENDVVAFASHPYVYEHCGQEAYAESGLSYKSLPQKLIFGPIFSVKRSILEKIPLEWLIIPKSKIEGNGYERRWALMFHMLDAKVSFLENDPNIFYISDYRTYLHKIFAKRS